MRGRGVLATLLALAVSIGVAAVARAGTDTGAPGIVVTSPSPSGFVSYGGVRLQAIGATGPTLDEWLGVADLTPSTNRVEMNFSPASFISNGNSGSTAGDCIGNYAVGTLAAPGRNDLTFTWDAAAGTLTSRLVTTTLDCTVVFRNFAAELATAKGWTLSRAQSSLADVNAVRILADDRQTGSSVTMTGGTVDGTSIGSFDPGAGASNSWLASDYDFDSPNGFTLGGRLNLGGTFASCESTCALEIKLGHFTPPNRSPVVSDHAADAAGHRGDTLATHGSFTDPDGDPLSITGSGSGQVNDHGDGTWGWRYVPSEDGGDAVTVTASDGHGGTATDTFAWSVTDIPPEVDEHAAGAAGSEGDTLTTQGSFTDADGDPLTITGSGAGSVADHGDGTWSWQHIPGDDGSGPVTVTATDGLGGTATDSFTWSAGNVPPTIVSLTPSATTVLAGATVTWTAVATDPGAADTFAWSFDGGAPVAGGLTTTFTTTYDTCGTYALDATVADDDGGSDHAVSDASVSVVGAQALAPVEDGARVVQKGQVVPVKVAVGCGDGVRADLHPTIELGFGGETYPASPVSAADTPGVMRWTEDAYLYNLRVPRSLGGVELAKGDRIEVLVRPFGPSGGAITIELEIRK
jgi:Bacterial Ig domain/PKD domain